MKLNKILMAAAGLAATVAISAQADTLNYDFNNGTTMGWQQLRTSTTAAGYYDAQFGAAQSFGRDGWGGGDNPYWHASGAAGVGPEFPSALGSYILTTTPFSATKGGIVSPGWAAWPDPATHIHQSFAIASPVFTIGSAADLSYVGGGGSGAGGAILNSVYAIPTVAGTWGSDSGNPDSTRGNGQVSLMNAVTGDFVLSKNFTQGDWTTYNMDLAAFANDGNFYSLVFMDFLGGTSADWAIDNVHMNNVTLVPGMVAVPEPSSIALLGLGGLALMFRRRK